MGVDSLVVDNLLHDVSKNALGVRPALHLIRDAQHITSFSYEVL